jgi:hypothetical protein
VKPAALKRDSTCSRIEVLKNHLGELPLDASKADESIASSRIGLRQARQLRDDSSNARNAAGRDELGHGANAAAVRKSLLWIGVRMNKKAETIRDRRLRARRNARPLR